MCTRTAEDSEILLGIAIAIERTQGLIKKFERDYADTKDEKERDNITKKVEYLTFTRLCDLHKQEDEVRTGKEFELYDGDIL